MVFVHWSQTQYIHNFPTYPLQTDRLKCLKFLPKPMADILAEMLDLKVLRNRGMMVLSAANVVGMLGFYVPLIFTAPRAVSLGVDGNSAALLLSIQGRVPLMTAPHHPFCQCQAISVADMHQSCNFGSGAMVTAWVLCFIPGESWLCRINMQVCSPSGESISYIIKTP